MNLIEQRSLYMAKLQSLIDARQKEIDEKVANYRAQLENEHVVPFRASLEKEKVTPEMNKLVEFIGQIDAMIVYEKSNTIDETHDNVEATIAETHEVEEVPEEKEIFSDEADSNTTSNDIDTEHNDANAEKVEDTVFDALTADIADTNTKLRASVEGRPGMSGIILPRR